MADFSSAIWSKPATAAAADDDVVTKSCRFEKSSSSNLNQINPTPDSAVKMTLSFWVKLVETPSGETTLFAFGGSAAGAGDQSELEIRQKPNGQIYVKTNVGNSYVYAASTTRVFRDFSSFYHIVIAWDTEQDAAADRLKFYVNNEQETLVNNGTASATFPTEDYSDRFGTSGTNIKNRIGSGVDGSNAYQYSSSYMADIIRIDGQQLTPSSFAEEDTTTGQWKPIDTSGLTFGSAGFRLDFEDDTEIGNDVSGEGNDFDDSGLSTHAIVHDCPTNNYCSFNSLNAYSAIVGMLTEGNLRVTTATGASGYQMMSTMGVSSGKWYYEYRDDSPSTRNTGIGWVDSGEIPTGTGSGAISGNGAIFYNDYIYIYGAGGAAGDTLDNGDIAGVALDADAGKIWFSINGTWWDSQDPAAGSNAKYTASTNSDIWVPTFMDGNYGQGTVNYGQDGTFAGAVTAQGNADGNGKGDFYYTPPSGFLALCTANLPTPTIAKPAEHFNTVTYAGNAPTGQTIPGVGFQPDLTWIKARLQAYPPYIADSVRGANKLFRTDNTDIEEATTNTIMSWNADGFVLGTGTTGINDSTHAPAHGFVAWNWLAETSFEAEDGVSDSGSKNVDAGFSIATWTGDDDDMSGTAQTIAHGLTVVPEMIIAKGRTDNNATGSSWLAYHKDLTSGSYLFLNNTDAETPAMSSIIDNIGTTSVDFGTDDSSYYFNFGGDEFMPTDPDTYVAYFMASVEGYSKVGSYTGNNDNDGPFVYCGFRPAFILMKSADDDWMSWSMWDDKRLGYNPYQAYLTSNSTAVEDDTISGSSSNGGPDFLSNGFKMRSTGGSSNASTGNYIFYAVAKNPFKYAAAR